MSTSNQSRPRRAARVRYNEDSDSVDLSDFETRPQPPRAVRRRIQTYREQSSDEDTTETSSDESDSLSEEVLPQQGTRSRPKRIHKPSTRPQKRKPQNAGTRTVANPFSAYKRQKTRSHDVNHSKAKDALTISLPPNGRIPPWQQLPYQILVSIMRYAAYPLYESRSRPTASIHWLCSLSRLCRSFHDACTAALLHNPPLYPDVRAYGLIHLLQQDPDRLMTNYRRKIHYLDIEVKHLLARKSGIALEDLISNTPLLQGMRLYSTYDDWRTEVWAQPGVRKIHWSYPPELFDLLDDNNVILKQFEWNGRFPSPTEVLETTLAAHSRPAFSRLQELSLLNLTPPDKSSDAEIAKFQSMFTSAFEHLTGLKRLSLINCGCLDESTTPMLPVGLEYLEIDNCSKLTSTALERYLQVGGSTIRTLKLCDNQSMSLGFMADLKSMCPRLQDIDVDMLYVDPTSYRDRDPLYDELLPNGPPTWPSSLVNVSFENMRQLSAEDAEDFFDSLVESSRHLPRLKRLNIKAILKNASWRDRAQLRKMWLPKLQNVFLNRSKPSGPVPVSAAGVHTKRASVSQRQSSRIAESLKRMSTGDDTGDSDAASSSLAIQGRCDVVNLQISDQRPAQDQFREDDFLDDEPSDDEEWMGVDREPVSTGYAW